MGSPSIDRSRRVGGLLQRELSELIASELGDPRVQGVTITDVKVTKDLREATIFVSRLDEAMQSTKELDTPRAPRERGARKRLDAEVAEHDYIGVLNKAAPLLRKHLRSRLTMKSTPNLAFRYDETIAQGFRITQLIDDGRMDASDIPTPGSDGETDS